MDEANNYSENKLKSIKNTEDYQGKVTVQD